MIRSMCTERRTVRNLTNTGMDISAKTVVCARCGIGYGRYKGNFPVSYAPSYKGIGYIPICRNCVDKMYAEYMRETDDPKAVMHQICRKLDIYWNERLFDSVSAKASNRSVTSVYLQRVAAINYAGKSYDDTLRESGELWNFDGAAATHIKPAPVYSEEQDETEEEPIDQELIDFWGRGYDREIYEDLDRRYKKWTSGLGDISNVQEALYKQVCLNEMIIAKSGAKGEAADKATKNLMDALGSLNIKPSQTKNDAQDAELSNTPLGVWLYRYETKRPLPEIDDDLKDVNGLRKYVFIWMGHLCKMLGLKNAYAKMYEDEIVRLRVDKPEYDGDDDETFFSEVMLDEPPGGGDDP